MNNHRALGLHRENLGGYCLHLARQLSRPLTYRFFAVLVVAPFPWLMQRIVDRSIPEDDMAGLLRYTGIAMVLLVAHVLLSQRFSRTLAERAQVLFRALRARIFHKINFMHFGFLDATQTGRLISKYAFDTHNIEMTVMQGIGILGEVVRAVFLIAVLTFIDPWLLVVVLVAIPIVLVVRLQFFQLLQENNRRVRRSRERMTGHASEYISAVKLVRGFGQEGVARNRVDAMSDQYSENRQAQMRLNQRLGYTVFALMSGLSFAAVAFGGWLVITDRMTLGALVALVGALPICLQPVQMITQFSVQYLMGAESYRSIRELLASGYVERWQGGFRPESLEGRVEFDHVSFAYDKESEARTIDGLDLRIEAGEHIAFVGPSGSGKSTIVSLMLGFYAPDAGEIRIDGVPQEKLAMRHFRQNCAVVMQDNVLLSGTLAENIQFGRPEASEAEVREAARQANALDFIEAMPEGFATKVGERGVTLSGGQRQRIAIARALLRDPRILILDEATSALDYESEQAVQEALDRLATGRTTITIAHRLSTIRGADRIIVLEHGRIAAQGTWGELAAREPAFQQLLAAQG